MNPSTKEPMSEYDYVESGGSVCPFCGSSDISACGPLDADSIVAWQNVTCSDCDRDWNDLYRLVGYEPTESH